MAELPVLEHLMFAGALENARYESALRVFQILKEEFFDWNEVRVSTIRDLADVAMGLPDPRAAAQRIKQSLQYIFESSYSFDLESLRKLPLGQAVEKLRKIDGATPFMVGYVVQHALGGHTIPLDAASLRVLNILGLADDSEVTSGTVAGLERAIPKTQGQDFAWALHEFAAEFWADHRAPQVVKIMKALDPQSLDRLEAWEAQEAHPAVPQTPVVAEQVAPVEIGPASPSSATEAPQGRRRRGRPRKNESAIAANSQVTPEVVKEAPQERPDVTKVPAESKQPRRQGRPPRTSQLAPETKRPRGRPPKAASDLSKKPGRKKGS
jgi:endonuclease-3